MSEFIRKVNYYETDRMGITHHSNYVRWMEEARLDYLDKIGYGLSKLEIAGITSPVISVECQYKQTTTFDDVIKIEVSVAGYNGVKLQLKYKMTKMTTGDIVCEGNSAHCFINSAGMPIVIRKRFPEFDAILADSAS